MSATAECQEEEIKVVKHSPVSTGQLRQLLALHHRPINLIVSQGAPGPLDHRNLISETASCLYAFSTYPCRT